MGRITMSILCKVVSVFMQKVFPDRNRYKTDWCLKATEGSLLQLKLLFPSRKTSGENWVLIINSITA